MNNKNKQSAFYTSIFLTLFFTLWIMSCGRQGYYDYDGYEDYDTYRGYCIEKYDRDGCNICISDSYGNWDCERQNCVRDRLNAGRCIRYENDHDSGYGSSSRYGRYGSSSRYDRYGSGSRYGRYGSSSRHDRYGSSSRHDRYGSGSRYDRYGSGSRYGRYDRYGSGYGSRHDRYDTRRYDRYRY